MLLNIFLVLVFTMVVVKKTERGLRARERARELFLNYILLLRKQIEAPA